jgi:DNA-binding MarR family transcriptional regulator
MTHLSDIHLAAWRALLNSHASAIREINRLLQDQGGLPLESYDVLLELYNAPDQRLRLRELGGRIVLTRSGISRLVTRLEKEGLVERGSVEEDARGVFAMLTSQGRTAFRRTWPLYADGIQQVFASRMTESEARIIADILDRVATEAT